MSNGAPLQSVSDGGAMGKYFAMMLHIDDDDLDLYEYRLLGHYRKMCGLSKSRTCFETTETTAKATRMGVNKVRAVRKSLKTKGCINLETPDGTTAHISILDRMAENLKRYSTYDPSRISEPPPLTNSLTPPHGLVNPPLTDPLTNKEYKKEKNEIPLPIPPTSVSVAADPPRENESPAISDNAGSDISRQTAKTEPDSPEPLPFQEEFQSPPSSAAPPEPDELRAPLHVANLAHFALDNGGTHDNTPAADGYEWMGIGDTKHFVKANFKTPNPVPLCKAEYEPSKIVTTGPSFDALKPCKECQRLAQPKPAKAPPCKQPHVAIIEAWFYSIPPEIRPIGDLPVERNCKLAAKIRDADVPPDRVVRFVTETYPTYRNWAREHSQPAVMSLEHVAKYLPDWWTKQGEQNGSIVAPTTGNSGTAPTMGSGGSESAAGSGGIRSQDGTPPGGISEESRRKLIASKQRAEARYNDPTFLPNLRRNESSKKGSAA